VWNKGEGGGLNNFLPWNKGEHFREVGGGGGLKGDLQFAEKQK